MLLPTMVSPIISPPFNSNNKYRAFSVTTSFVLKTLLNEVFSKISSWNGTFFLACSVYYSKEIFLKTMCLRHEDILQRRLGGKQ